MLPRCLFQIRVAGNNCIIYEKPCALILCSVTSSLILARRPLLSTSKVCVASMERQKLDFLLGGCSRLLLLTEVKVLAVVVERNL